MFYNFHARRQGTNSPLATNNFVKRGLNWSLEKVKRIKRILKELKLIEVKRKGKFYYVVVPYIYTKQKIKEVLDKRVRESHIDDEANQTEVVDKKIEKVERREESKEESKNVEDKSKTVYI